MRILENRSAESIWLSQRSPAGMSFVSCKVTTRFERVVSAERVGVGFPWVTPSGVAELTGARPGKGSATWRVLALRRSEFASP